MAWPLMVWGCLWQEGWSNMELQAHSPTNEIDQCLNWSAKKNYSLLKFFEIFISLSLPNTNVTKKIALSLTNF